MTNKETQGHGTEPRNMELGYRQQRPTNRRINTQANKITRGCG